MLMALTVVAPFLAEWLHLVPPSYQFHAGELVLHARAVAHRPGITTGALPYTSVTFSTRAGLARNALGVVVDLFT